MNTNLKYELLIRYVQGECTEEEKDIIEENMAEDEKLRNDIHLIGKLWKSGKYSQHTWDLDSAYDRLKKDKERLEKTGNMVLVHPESESVKTAPLQSSKHLYTRTGGSQYKWLKRVAAVLLIAGLPGLIYFLLNREILHDDSHRPVLSELVTERGQRAQIQLTDGSQVEINVKSRLTYPEVFGEENRTVHLTGEAYFEIEKDERPFYVIADKAVIEILGTSFNVYAYEDEEEIEVVVASGKVSLMPVNGMENGEYTLEKGDRGAFSREGNGNVVVQHNVDLRNYIGWLEHRMVFNDQPLSRVARELERWFGVNIRFADPELSERRITATFENDRFSTIVRMLEISLDLEMERQNNTVIFYAADKTDR